MKSSNTTNKLLPSRVLSIVGLYQALRVKIWGGFWVCTQHAKNLTEYSPMLREMQVSSKLGLENGDPPHTHTWGFREGPDR
jgi:hypothetical protein